MAWQTILSLCTHSCLQSKEGILLLLPVLFHPRTRYLCLRISLMLRRDTIIALRTFVQSASSLTALTTSINNIKSNIIIGSYCDSRSHLYISDHQIRPPALYNTLQTGHFIRVLWKIQSGGLTIFTSTYNTDILMMVMLFVATLSLLSHS